MSKSTKITLQSLPEGWQEVTIDIYKDGGGDEEVQAELGMTQGAFLELLEHEDFGSLIRTGRKWQKAWWLRWGRKNLTTRGANYSGWFMQMKNLFGWTDKQEQVISEGEISNLSDDALDRKLKAIEDKLLDQLQSPQPKVKKMKAQ